MSTYIPIYKVPQLSVEDSPNFIVYRTTEAIAGVLLEVA